MSTTLPDTGSTVHDIARAREEMGRTLFLLGDRLAPKKVIARLKEKTKITVTDKVAELKVRFNPVEVVRRKVGASPKVIDVRARESAERPALSR
jgi:hypothetical protein